MQQGELTVIGQDSATIALRSFPSKVECKFKDHAIVIPCSPHSHDELESSVHHSISHHGKYDLKITWNVATIREVVWRVWY